MIFGAFKIMSIDLIVVLIIYLYILIKFYAVIYESFKLTCALYLKLNILDKSY